MIERKTNYLLLPSILGSSREERDERQRVNEILPKYLALKIMGRVNSGSRSAILASNTDGYGKFSLPDKLGHDVASDNLRNSFGESTIIKDATALDLKSVIRDPNFQNIIVIGHASYHSWVASDRSVNWYELGKMVGDHLKNGLFINIGCGAINSWNKIPLGYFVIDNPQNLFGKKAEYLDDNELLDPLRHVQRLDPRLSLFPQV